MNINEFAQKHLKVFIHKGDEIIPLFCPFCHGGQKHDKQTFALNVISLTYNCKRGKCGVAGTFSQLCREFNEVSDREADWRDSRKYVPPKVDLEPPTTIVEEYLGKRGISKRTIKEWDISEKDGNIVFPYYEKGKLVFVKYRPAREIVKGERKSWREKGGKPVFFGIDKCDHSKPLTICEGEIDCLSVYEAGIKNVVSIPSGTGDLTCVKLCWDWLEKFNEINVWGDNDAAGYEFMDKLILRLGSWRCKRVKSDRKDANEILVNDGKEKIKELIKNAEEIPVEGLINAKDIEPIDYSKIECVRFNIKTLDVGTSGYALGRLSVWTGKTGDGKSTFLSQIIVEALEQNCSTCVYSGELTAQDFLNLIQLQIARKENLKTVWNPITENERYVVPSAIVPRMKEWYGNRLFLYDNRYVPTEKEESNLIIKMFIIAARKYGCKVFLVDNLMTARFSLLEDRNYWRAQSEFVGLLMWFCKAYNVHVHLVAHPRKNKEFEGGIGIYDIKGSADIVNRADNLFSIERKSKEGESGVDMDLVILKHRRTGILDVKYEFYFDKNTKRFYQTSEELDKIYGWEEEKCPF